MTDETKPKVILLLQDSNSKTCQTGVVYDFFGETPINSDEVVKYELESRCEAVGTWTRLSCGIVISLTTSIEARQDILINLLKGLRQSRIDTFGSPDVIAIYPRATDTSKLSTPVRKVDINKQKNTQEGVSKEESNKESRFNASLDTVLDTRFEDLRNKLLGLGR